MADSWYREWYITSPEGEANLRAALADPEHGEKNRADVEKRFEEIKKIPEGRCAIALDQKRFLGRVMGSL